MMNRFRRKENGVKEGGVQATRGAVVDYSVYL